MRGRRTFRALAWVLLALPGTSSEPADEPVVLFTADRGGVLSPCATCPSASRKGGVARAATLIRAQREAGPLLLLDGGNGFFGSAEAGGDPGEAVRDVYDVLGYDVVNVSYRDFRHGLDTVRTLFAEAAFTPVSANLLDAEGRHLFDPFAVEAVGGSAVAVIGVTRSPPGLDYLPHLRRQLEGVTVADPLAALAEVLPRARADADHVVLLCYGDRDLVEAIRTRFGGEIDAIAVGDLRPDELPSGGGPRLAASTTAGQHLTRFSLVDGGTPELVAVSDDVAPDASVREELAEVLHPASLEVEHRARPLPAGALPAAGHVAVDVRNAEPGMGSGLNVRVTSVSREAVWQGLDPPAGTSWLVLRLTVENDVPPSLAHLAGRAAGERLLVLQEQKLFLLCGEGARAVVPAARVARPTDAGALLPERFELARVGARRSGEVAFALPEAAFDSGPLQVHLHHDEVAPAVTTLRGEVPPEELSPESGNEYVEMARPGVTFPETWNGTAAPDGARWVVVTLHGRSLSTGSAPAGQSEPAGKLAFGEAFGAQQGEGGGEPAPRPRPAHYLEAASHLELVVDGMWARRAEPGLGSLPDEPVFLPERFTGGTAVFLAPRGADSLELSCAFPTLTLESGDDLKPAPIRFTLEGEPVEPSPEHAAVVVEDGTLPLAIVGAELRRRLGSLEAAEGRALLSLDCRIRNGGEEGFFAPSGRFGLVADESSRAVGVLDRWGLAMDEPFLLPVGERRAFRVVLDVPEDVRGARELSYAGVSVSPTFTLDVPPLEVGDTQAPPPPVAAATPSAPATDSVWRDRSAAVPEPAWSTEPRELEPSTREVTEGGLTLAVTSALLTRTIREHAARDGEIFLRLGVRISLGPEAGPARMRDLAGGLPAVLDGRKLLARPSITLNGALSTTLSLGPGEVEEGDFALVLPDEPFRSLSLGLVAPPFPPLRLPLLAGPAPEPVVSASNQAFRLDLLGFEAVRTVDRFTAPEGETFVLADMRIRNHLEGPAGIDLLAWSEPQGSVQLVLDGLHSVPVLPGEPTENGLFRLSTLPTDPLGGRLAFRVSDEVFADARSVELVCGFEEVELPGGGLVRPDPLRLPLAGERPEVEVPEGLARFADEALDVVVAALERPGTVEGAEAGTGRRWSTADVWLRAGERGVFVDPVRRFVLLDGGGESVPPHQLSWSTGSPAPRGAPFWIPPGGVRRLRLAFVLPEERFEGAAFMVRGLLGQHFVPLDPASPQRLPQLDIELASTGQRVSDPTRVPQGLAGVDLDPQEVNLAIDRGRDFLWSHVLKVSADGDLAGNRLHLPVALALLHCDAHLEYPEFDQAVRRLLTELQPAKTGVYELGLLAMIVEAYEDEAFLPLLQGILTCLVEGQGEAGSWTYVPPLPARLFGRPEDAEPKSALWVEGGEPPGDDRDSEPIERTQAWSKTRNGDNSVSQFAVLGLATAERHGMAIAPDTWRRSLVLSDGWQQLDAKERTAGGWGYGAGTPYGSMTCAGICSTAIALRRLAPERDPREDLRIRDGLAWLERHWSLTENPFKKDDWRYYHLYGVERVGRILGTEFIGEHEWYPEGARVLVDEQREDGAWVGGGQEADPRLATSFALLFLTRATESLNLDEEPEPEPEGPGTLVTTADLRASTDGVYVILDASGSMLGASGERRKFDVAREAVLALAAALPDGTPFALRAYGHRKRAIEEGAAEDTELLLPFAPLEYDALAAVLGRLRARGKTPITLSLEETTEDVRALEGGAARGSVLVLLLTDGGEDTRRDPVAAARKLAELRDVGLWVVGFDIDRPEWTKELGLVAAAAGGRYVQVDAADALAAAVAHVAAPEPPTFLLANAAGETVAEGRFGDELSLDPAEYTLSFEFSDEPHASTFWVKAGRTTRVRFDPAAAGSDP